MSTGPSVPPNAPIATSTAMCGHVAPDQARYVAAFGRDSRPRRGARRAAPCPRSSSAAARPRSWKPATVGAILEAIARLWTVDARLRGDAGGQPDQRRGGALPRLPRRRRQPRLARRPGPRRRRPQEPRAHPFGRRGAARGRRRPPALRPLFLRPDLCPPGQTEARMGGRAPPRDRGSRRASVALPADHRARHDVRGAAQGRQARHARRRDGPRALRPDAGGLRRGGPAGL
jgi:hypothetical protein